MTKGRGRWAVNQKPHMIPRIFHFRNFMGNGTSCDKESLFNSKEFEINKVVVGTRFRRNDFWDLLNGQALLMIGCLEYHRPIMAAPKLVANSPQGF